MTIAVLLFGPEAATAGCESILVETGPAPTAEALLRSLADQYPALRPALRSARLAVNHAFAPPDQPINPGDEVALIGAVSGG